MQLILFKKKIIWNKLHESKVRHFQYQEQFNLHLRVPENWCKYWTSRLFPYISPFLSQFPLYIASGTRRQEIPIHGFPYCYHVFPRYENNKKTFGEHWLLPVQTTVLVHPSIHSYRVYLHLCSIQMSNIK